MSVVPVPVDAVFPEPFQPLFGRYRYKIYHGGRGAGKTQNFARALLIQASREALRVLCGRELQKSIQDSVHKVLSDQIDALKMNYLYEVQQATIKGRPGGPNAGAEFNFEGIRHNASKIKSYEGIDRFWMEEAQGVTHGSWEVVIPTIRKRGSEIWVSFNPDLETDDTYQRFIKNGIAQPPHFDPTEYDGWSVVKEVNYYDNPWFPDVLRAEMEALRATDYDAYAHIWLGQCKQLMEGAVYATELREASLQQRLTKVAYNPEFPVFTFWDLGWADMTVVWFAQLVGFEVHIIDYYENRQKPLNHYLEMLQSKRYVYDTHWLPHDARAKEKGSGRSIEEQMKLKGFKVRVVPRLSLADGINIARTIFPNCYFDIDQCADGVQALRHYRYEVVDKQTGQLSLEPVHDWSSHAADGFRYLAVALRQPRANVSESIVKALDPKMVRLHRNLDRIGRSQVGWMR